MDCRMGSNIGVRVSDLGRAKTCYLFQNFKNWPCIYQVKHWKGKCFRETQKHEDLCNISKHNYMWQLRVWMKEWCKTAQCHPIQAGVWGILPILLRNEQRILRKRILGYFFKERTSLNTLRTIALNFSTQLFNSACVDKDFQKISKTHYSAIVRSTIPSLEESRRQKIGNWPAVWR